MPPVVQALATRRPARQLIEAAALGARNFRLAGDSWAQGGTLVLAPDGAGGHAVAHLHREEHPADHRPMAEILAAAGLPSPSPPVNYSTALDKYLAAVTAGGPPPEWAAAAPYQTTAEERAAAARGGGAKAAAPAAGGCGPDGACPRPAAASAAQAAA